MLPMVHNPYMLTSFKRYKEEEEEEENTRLAQGSHMSPLAHNSHILKKHARIPLTSQANLPCRDLEHNISHRQSMCTNGTNICFNQDLKPTQS